MFFPQASLPNTASIWGRHAGKKRGDFKSDDIGNGIIGLEDIDTSSSCGGLRLSLWFFLPVPILGHFCYSVVPLVAFTRKLKNIYFLIFKNQKKKKNIQKQPQNQIIIKSKIFQEIQTFAALFKSLWTKEGWNTAKVLIWTHIIYRYDRKWELLRQCFTSFLFFSLKL